MASVRLPYSSSSSSSPFFHFKQQQQLIFLSSFQISSISNHGDSHISLSRSSLSFSSPSLIHNPLISIRAKRTRKLIFHFASSTSSQEQAVSTFSSETEEPKIETEEFSETRLIAQNVPWHSTPEDIRSLFEKFGTVLDVELSMYNKTRNRGLAFVTMGSPEEALAALNNLESYVYEDRTLRVNYAKVKKEKAPPPPPQPKPVTFNLFVANLPFEARAKDLREYFDSGSGNVDSAQVIFHENPRRSSGYGFVAFKSKKDAEAAISAFQGKIFMGRSIRIARSKQFVKVPSEEKSQPEASSSDAGVEQASVANGV